MTLLIIEQDGSCVFICVYGGDILGILITVVVIGSAVPCTHNFFLVILLSMAIYLGYYTGPQRS
jgi:hypothetical protein